MSVLGIILVMQSFAVGLFLAVVLGGILSALVYLTYFEMWERPRLQEQELRKFCGYRWAQLCQAEPLFTQRISFRLHYRQICGQLMSRVNEETVSPSRQPVTAVLLEMASDEGATTAETPEDKINCAMRVVDRIQLHLATAISRRVLEVVSLVWFCIYVLALILTWIFGSIPGSESAVSWLGAIIRFAVFFVVLWVLACAVAVATAAVAVVAFTWIDRVVSAR